MNSIEAYFTLFGGLGIYVFGLKSLTLLVQESFGRRITKTLRKEGQTPIETWWNGIIVSLLGQSTFFTVTMYLGLANSRLISLTQGLIFLSTTSFSALLPIFLLYNNFDIYGLPLLSFGVISSFIFSKFKIDEISQAFIYIGMIIFGLGIMRLSGPVFEIFPIDQVFKDLSLLNTLLICGVSLLASLVIPLVLITIPLALIFFDFHNFHEYFSICFVLFSFVGPSIRRYLKIRPEASIYGKRAAFGNTIINVFLAILGVIISFGLYRLNFSPFLTVFLCMLCSSFLSILLRKAFVKVLEDMFKENGHKEQGKLVALGNSSSLSVTSSIIQLEMELNKMHDILGRMFLIVIEYLGPIGPSARALAKIKDYERITDNMHSEIAEFIKVLMERPMNIWQSHQVHFLNDVGSELETIADYLDKLVTYKTYLDEHEDLDEESYDDLKSYTEKLFELFKLVVPALDHENSDPDENLVNSLSTELRVQAKTLRQKHISKTSQGVFSALSAVTFSDIIMVLKRIRVHSFLIFDAWQRGRTDNR